jgi:cell division protein FtsQ
MKRFTRRARRRLAGWFTGGGILVMLVLLVVTAVYSPLLALRTIKVEGTDRLSAAALQAALAPNVGTPLALLDDARIKRELGRFSLIRSYVTQLEPPGTLVVHVSERVPVGVIQGADDYQLVDPAGVVVERSAKRPDGVPVIQLGTAPLDGPGFASMAQVLLALPAALRAQVDTVAARTHDDVTLTLRGSGQRVLWGSADQSALKAEVLARLRAGVRRVQQGRDRRARRRHGSRRRRDLDHDAAAERHPDAAAGRRRSGRRAGLNPAPIVNRRDTRGASRPAGSPSVP